MTLKPLLMGLGALALGVGLAACQTTPAPVEETAPVEEVEVMPTEEELVVMNVVDTAAEAGQFNTLLSLATQAGLVETLSTQPLTLFAPTDEVFAKLPEDTLKQLQSEPEKLAEVLKYHVVSGVLPASEVVQVKSLSTLQGQSLKVTVNDESVKVDDATIITTDVMASNGVIHVIDSVMLPLNM